jgi:alkanesulfonate monooxygenase SsuD/methylene tetrahydromethanopterin reductase-like flavin-dependent oxidoreductase (luciferase family)
VGQFCDDAEKRNEAMRRFERICRRYLETFADAVVSWKGRNEAEYPGYDKMVTNILAATPDRIIAQGGAFVGTSEDVVEQVHGCMEAFGGPIEPSMQVNFGGSRDDEALRTIELLAAKVMPRFR